MAEPDSAHNDKPEEPDSHDNVGGDVGSSVEAYFTHCNPHSKQAMAMLELRRHKYLVWDRGIDFDCDDYDELESLLTKDSGEGKQRVEAIMGAYYRMSELLKLHALATTLWHLDVEHWIAIDRALCKAGGYNALLFDVVDEMLVKLLTPTKPAQRMATKRTITSRITREIDAYDSSLRVNEKKNSRKTYTVNDLSPVIANGDDSHEFRFDTNAATAIEVDARIRQHAQDAGISLRDAAVELLLGKGETTTLTLNCYRANDIAGAPLFVETSTGTGVATLFGDAANDLASRASKHRDMDATMHSEVTGYVTTPAMRSAVAGRDGHCRYPGCNRPAAVCQMDHVVEFNRGGPTTPDNLMALCQHHHNIKTDRRIRPILDPASGTVVWLHADGSWQSTEAEGPLAGSNRRWAQTVAQKIECYRQASRENAEQQHRREQQREEQRQEQRKNQQDEEQQREQRGEQQGKQAGCPSPSFAAENSADRCTWLTKTQEEEMWARNMRRLELALADRSFSTVRIPQCRAQLEKIRAAVAILKEQGPGAEVGGGPHEQNSDEPPF